MCDLLYMMMENKLGRSGRGSFRNFESPTSSHLPRLRLPLLYDSCSLGPLP